MRVQNLAIIFLVIIVPIILVLSYYLDLQQDTLKLQTEYDTKIAAATKEGIRAFEINTVEWSEWESDKTRVAERNDVNAAINSFITSLANNINISGTAKEYMSNYIPAVAMTMYDGYYIYSPNYVPVTIKNDEGLELYYDEYEDVLTQDSEEGANKIAYKPKNGVSSKWGEYKYKDDAGNEVKKTYNFVTDIDKAETEYKHFLSSQIAYLKRYKTSNDDVIVNYTLDNRIYIYGTVDGKYVEKEGYLVYFENNSVLPKISISSNNIAVNIGISGTSYSNGEIATNIGAEILEEQILYYNGGIYELKTFKYVYDINHEKLYYDDATGNFFTYSETSGQRQFIVNNSSVTVGSNNCKYKSVSVLKGNTGREYIKLYQVLNGTDKGKWYINVEEDSEEVQNEGKEGIDTHIDSIKLSQLGLSESTAFSNICKDYSAISYYVEAYVFTNWVESELGGSKVDVDGTQKAIFEITASNNPEKEDSPIAIHKREVMKENIITNLNLAISNYSMGTYRFQLPVLTNNDWEQVFSNISMMTFFQGVPIGLKNYNNYAIATSTTNREYVNPKGIYFSGADKNYHRPYCNKCNDGIYMGYRSVEYTQRTLKNTVDDEKIYYYQHDNQLNNYSETACYYCIINRENYIEAKTGNKIQAYYEALARERYYQKVIIQSEI